MTKEFITSWDDGGQFDTSLATLNKRFNIPAIFYIPTNCELSKKQIRSLAIDFEIGGHTTHHYELTRMCSENILYEIKENRDYLRNLTGQDVHSFCYPKGYYNKDVIANVKLAGYREARTVKRLNTETPKNKFEIETTIHAYPNHKEQGRWLEKAKEIWDTDPDYFHLWGHSAELQKYSLWDELEEFYKYIND